MCIVHSVYLYTAAVVQGGNEVMLRRMRTGESCARLRVGLILSILRCGVGLTRADSLLRVCGEGGWRLPSSAGSRGQGRLGDVSGLDRPLLSAFPLSELPRMQNYNLIIGVD